MEMMDVIDENDKIMGQDYRKNLHSSGKWHRGIHILIFVSGKILIQKRSKNKDKEKEKLDLSVSEHLKEGEDYEEAALRSMKEELGIENIELERIGKFRMNYGKNDNMICVFFKCEYEGSLSIDKKEISEILFFTEKELKKLIVEEKEKFAKWTREYLKYYFKMNNELEKL